MVDVRLREDHDPEVDPSDVSRLEAAVVALNDGELEPFVGLITDDMVWTGQAHRWLWWRQTPS